VAAFIAQNSGREESNFVYGSEPQIYCYAGRKSATRYIFVYPLMTAFADVAGRQQAALAEIRRCPAGSDRHHRRADLVSEKSVQPARSGQGHHQPFKRELCARGRCFPVPERTFEAVYG
jgi:hypothetical protein